MAASQRTSQSSRGQRIRFRILFFAIVALLCLGGCERARRVPRIEPVLQGWERPYRGIPDLEIHVSDTGSLSLPRGFLFQGGSWLERTQLPTPAYVIRHPGGGAIVYDTGFSERINRDPNRYIGFFASVVGRFAMREAQGLAAQMRKGDCRPTCTQGH